MYKNKPNACSLQTELLKHIKQFKTTNEINKYLFILQSNYALISPPTTSLNDMLYLYMHSVIAAAGNSRVV
jgi:hypothetical protein